MPRVGTVERIVDGAAAGQRQLESGGHDAALVVDCHGRGKLAVDPCQPPAKPILHPVDFSLPGWSDVVVGPDVDSQHGPFGEVSRLGLLDGRGRLVDACQEAFGGEFVLAEVSPAVDQALPEIGIVGQTVPIRVVVGVDLSPIPTVR